MAPGAATLGRGGDCDPARTGLGRPGVSAVVRAQPEVLVLVSCDPVSFARDAALLEKEGFRLERCEALDLFPALIMLKLSRGSFALAHWHRESSGNQTCSMFV